MSILMSTLGDYQQQQNIHDEFGPFNSSADMFDPSVDMFPEENEERLSENYSISLLDEPNNATDRRANSSKVGKVKKVVSGDDKNIVRKNRNAQKQFVNLKNKIEQFQKNFGYEENFLFIMKNNFVQNIGSRGPSCASAGKYLVSGGGEIFENLKNEGIEYDIETMEVLKNGKSMKENKSFLQSYVKNCRNKQVVRSKAASSPTTSEAPSNRISSTPLDVSSNSVRISGTPVILVNQSDSGSFIGPTPDPKKRVRKNAKFSKRKSLISTFTDLQSSRKRQSSSDSSECSDGNISLHDSTDLDTEGEDLARKVEALNQKKNKRNRGKNNTLNDTVESDHGTEVRGAGADKNKRKKAPSQAADRRKKSNTAIDIINEANKENAQKTVAPKTRGRRKPLSDTSVMNMLDSFSTPNKSSYRNNNIVTPLRPL